MTEERLWELRNRKSRGVRLLDSKVPGWRKEIDWSELRLQDPYCCILGQLFGYDLTGVRELREREDTEDIYHWEVERGFAVVLQPHQNHREETDWGILTRLWQEEEDKK